MDKAERETLLARFTDEDGYCKHGLVINYCKQCFQKVFPDLDVPSNLLGDTTQRHVMRDGELTATIEIQRPRQHKSGKLFYHPVTQRLAFGHYFSPRRGWWGGLASMESWERLSRTDLTRLLANTLWALRRKKAEQGHGKELLHGPIPQTIWLTAEIRELMEELNKIATNPRLEKTYRNPERKPLTSSRSSTSVS